MRQNLIHASKPAGISIDHPIVKLLLSSPAVMTTRRVPRFDEPVKHRTAVSESHCVATQVVALDLPRAVELTRTIDTPCRVILAEPVTARLDLHVRLTVASSNEYTCDTVPSRSPAVITTLLVAATPPGPRQRKEVWDAHSVVSVFVCSNLALALNVSNPRPLPSKVTLEAPVPG